MSPTTAQRPAVFALFALALMSGALALGYEVLWIRELLNLLGSTTRASTLVLSGFMGGLAVGAFITGRLTKTVRRPLLIFACAEAALGGFGFVLPSVLRFIAGNFSGDVLLDAGLVAVLLAPASLMGAALPALAAALQQSNAGQARHVAALYGLNTLGGAAAAFGVGLVVLPGLGLAVSGKLVASSGLLLAALGCAMSRRVKAISTPAAENARAGSFDFPPARFARAVVLSALLVSGVAALGYEVLWTRILLLIVGSSSMAFALMLGLYLLGLALGGFLMSRLPGWERRAGRTFCVLQLSVGATALLGASLFGWLPAIALFGFAQLGTAPSGILAVDLLLIAAIILPPTLFMGASFPVAACLVAADRPHRGREVGLALAVTTAGNMIGILLTAFVVIPMIGLQQGVAVMAALNALAAIAMWLVARGGSAKLRYAMPAAALVVGLVGAVLPPWDIAVMSSGVFRQAPLYLALLGNASRLERAFSAYETRYYREGSEAVVAVFDRPTLQGAPHRVLTIDGKVDASTGADMATQVLSGHLPFLFRPQARNALVIGLASGVTVGALTQHGLDRIDVIEIEPAVVAASRAFDDVSGSPLRDSRVSVMIGDGRRYLRTAAVRYDAIISEPSNPWLSMSARLFTREFFEIVRTRLAPRGVLVQWIPLYGLSTRQFEALLRALLDVFPNIALFRVAEGDLIAIAGVDALSVHPGSVDELFKGSSRKGLERIGVTSPAQLLALWVADNQGIESIIGRGEINTDDNGLLEFGSPWYLLSDTTPGNLSVVDRAGASSRFVPRLVEAWSTRAGGFELLLALAGRYRAAGRIAFIRKLAAALRSGGRISGADLLLGDVAAMKGRWSEADGVWSRHDAPVFYIRRARTAFRIGDVAKAVRLFQRVPTPALSDDDNLIHALALAAAGRNEAALDLLTALEGDIGRAAGIIIPFMRSALSSGLGKPQRAGLENKIFEARLDSLRRCREADGCKGMVDRLLAWSRVAPPGLPPRYRERFRQALYVRVTRPLPVFMRGVTALWLGENARARSSLRTYLKLLPEPDPRSKAHHLLEPFDG